MYNRAPLFPLCLTFISAALLLLSTSSLAAYPSSYNRTASYKMPASQPQSSVNILNDGLYLGLAGGYDSYRVHQNATPVLNGDTITANPVINPTGFVGGIFGGYGEYINTVFYLGGEAFVNISGASVNSYTFSDAVGNSSYSSSFTVGTSFGLGLLPGLKLNDSSLFYLRLGYSYVNLKSQESVTVAGVNTATDSNNWGGSFVYGLGLETSIYKNFSLRTEYTHVDYNSFNTDLGTSYSPTDNQFMLGLLYHIA